MMIETLDLWKSYNGTDAVKALNLRIEEGRSFGLVGPNGAGKTTTIRMLAGLLQPTSGVVRIDGVDIFANPKTVMPKIGYLPDEYGMYDGLRVFEFLDYYAGLYGVRKGERQERVERLLSLVRLGNWAGKFVGELSRGMKQRLMIAKTLVHNPEVLFLDEPTSGLDPRSRAEVVEVLQHLASINKTMVVASNILYDLSSFCDSLGVMDRGVLVDTGTLDELSDKYCREKVLRITVVSGMNRIEEVLSQDKGVRSFSVEGDSVTLCYDGTVEDVANLNEKLVRAGVRLTGLCQERRTIEEIFLRATS
ncbi:MAG: ABC transporter ATP-binding protein [Planctomycetota bacterium]|nr:ABC transporter ATP-binding protein [Planctomycetota bacterium]